MYILDFGKTLFRKENIGVIIYLVLNMILYVGLLGGFSDGGMAGLGILIYLITLCLALSPVGEFMLRMQTGCRKIKRQDYLQRLMPLFEEVYAQAKAKDPTISDKVKLFMSESKSPNAFATGRKTICLTKGFLSYSDAQIKGTLAHEFAHLANKDTDLTLVIHVGNMLMSALFVIWRVIINIFVFMFATALRMRFLGTFLTSLFINLLLTFFMWVWGKIGSLLCMHSSRQHEYAADAFAFELGYGNDLCVVLDSFGGEEVESRSVWAQLHSSHPDSDDRIARLQEMGARYTNMYGHDVHAINTRPEDYGYSHQTQPHLPPQGTGYQRPTPMSSPRAGVPSGAAAIAPAQAYAPAPPVNQSSKLLCTKCSAQIEPYQKFCEACGTPAPVSQIPAPVPGGPQFSTPNAQYGAPGSVQPPQQAPVNAQFGAPGAAQPAQQPPVNAQYGAPGVAQPAQQPPVNPQYGAPGVAQPAQQAPVNAQYGAPGAAQPVQQAPVNAQYGAPGVAQNPQQPPVNAQYGAPGSVQPPQQAPVNAQFGTPGAAHPAAAAPATQNCRNCGRSIIQGNKFCPGCGSPAGAPERICRQCSSKLEPNDKFCSVCGTTGA